MSDSVRVEWDGHVATLTINRPERLNALDEQTLEELADALDETRDRARALIVTGGGDDAFVAGADIRRMAEMDVAEAHAYCELGHRVMNAVESFPAPVIAAVNGYAFGGGCELALAADLRVASERAVLGQTEIDLGIVPGWGGTQRLIRLVGDEMARRLVFFGERVDAQDAMEYDLVGEVVAHDELDDRVTSLAEDLAAKPHFALAGAKDAINQAHEMGQGEGLDFERRLWSSLFGTHDQKEGMQAFINDRDPEFN